VTARVIGSTAHTIEVEVKVMAENAIISTCRETNTARAWYVAVAMEEPDLRKRGSVAPLRPLPVPPFPYATAAEAVAAEERQRQQQGDRRADSGLERLLPVVDATLAHALNPAECSLAHIAQAGVVMKLMDHAAGIAAVRHTRLPCVTASLEAVNFLRPV